MSFKRLFKEENVIYIFNERGACHFNVYLKRSMSFKRLFKEEDVI